MLRQTAWLLVHVGVRAAHLYLYSCNQQPRLHTSSLQQVLASTKHAYQLVEMGKLADHSKGSVLQELLQCWAVKVCAYQHTPIIKASPPPHHAQPVLVLLLAHPLVLHALQRDVQECGFSVQHIGQGDTNADNIASALQAVAPPITPCCVCLPSSLWTSHHITSSVLHGVRR